MDAENLKEIGEKGKDWIIKNRSWEKISCDYLRIINQLQPIRNKSILQRMFLNLL